MILLIDIGNTRIKWALLEQGELTHRQAAVHASWSDADCDVAFAVLPRPQRVLVSNVGGDRIGAVVREVAIARWGVAPTFVQSSAAAAGIRNAYPDVWKLGVDRWVGMIGAHAIHRRAVCVVNIGTAATIDGVDNTGRHLGGVIIPGPDLMVDSLLKNTSGIARRAETGSIGAGVFANNTLGAIHQGALHAVAALAERAVESMQVQLGEQPQLVLTGGASADVARLIRFPHVATPDLVLEGLAVLAQGAPE
jgi:type III pantothenate kinase